MKTYTFSVWLASERHATGYIVAHEPPAAWGILTMLIHDQFNCTVTRIDLVDHRPWQTGDTTKLELT